MLCDREMAREGRHKDKNCIIQNNIMAATTQQKVLPNMNEQAPKSQKAVTQLTYAMKRTSSALHDMFYAALPAHGDGPLGTCAAALAGPIRVVAARAESRPTQLSLQGAPPRLQKRPRQPPCQQPQMIHTRMQAPPSCSASHVRTPDWQLAEQSPQRSSQKHRNQCLHHWRNPSSLQAPLPHVAALLLTAPANTLQCVPIHGLLPWRAPPRPLA
jgi:hypothetical protein